MCVYVCTYALCRYVDKYRSRHTTPCTWSPIRSVTRGLHGLGVYKILFYFEAYVHELIILLAPRPPALPTLLHYYFTIITQSTTPLRPPLCMPYIIQYGSW